MDAEMRPSSEVVDPIVMKLVVALIFTVGVGEGARPCGAERLVRLVRMTNRDSFTGGKPEISVGMCQTI